ncbi:MAG: hypothetical protein Kow0010_14590 [Dehalococcoidia bacterium]
MHRIPGLALLERNLRRGALVLGLLAILAGLSFGWAYALPFLALLSLAQYAALERRAAERDEALTQCQIWRARAEVIRVAADDRPGATVGDRRSLQEGWLRMRATFNRRNLEFSVALFEARPTLGSAAGDMLADVVSEALSQTVRQEDVVARLDQATFAVLLSGANLHGAVAFIGRVADTIERHTMGAGGPVFEQVAVGAAAWEPSMHSLADLLHAADSRMHRARERGGDVPEIVEADSA